MTRKAVWFCGGYLLGIFYAAIRFTNLTAALIVTAFTIFFTVFIAFKFGYKNLLVCGIALIIGFSIYENYTLKTYQPLIEMSGQTVHFEGEISEISDNDCDTSGYILKGNINGEKANISYYGQGINGGFGDKIIADFTVTEIENKYTFPAKDYYKSKDVFLQTSKLENLSVIPVKFSLKKSIYNFRENLMLKFQTILGGNEIGIINALVLGDKTQINEDTQLSFRNSGISHVTSVSGFHMSLITGIVFWVCSALGLNSKKAFPVTEIILFMYAMLTGFSISVIRAFIMITLCQLAVLIRRENDILSSLSIAIVFMTFNSPYLIANPSFLLSITGVYAVGSVAPYCVRKLYGENKNLFTKITKPFVFAAVIAITILPVTMLFFDTTSVSSPIANVIIVPILSLACILAAITAMIFFFGLFAYPLVLLAGLLCKIALFMLNFINVIGTIPVKKEYIFFCIAAAGFLLIIYSAKQDLFVNAFLCCLIFYTLFFNFAKIGSSNITTENFGGTWVISQNGRADIIDGGSRFDHNSVEVYLQKNNLIVNRYILLGAEQYLYKIYGEKIYVLIDGKDRYTDNLAGIQQCGKGSVFYGDNYEIILEENNDDKKPFILSLR